MTLPYSPKMGWDTMSAWDKTSFEFNDSIQRRGGPWLGSIPWNSPPGRSISQDDYKPPSPLSSRKSASPSPVELPATPLFRDATASWSPTASPLASPTGSTLSPPESPHSDSARIFEVQSMAPMTAKEKRKLGEKLYAAACAGDLEHIKLLLSLGASVNSSALVNGLYESFKPAKAGSLSPLAGAAGSGQLDAVELLIARGAKLNPHVNESSSSPLHEAVRADDLEVTHFLLQIGADIDSMNAYNTTPLMYAVKYAGAEMVQLLLTYNPNLAIKSFLGAAAVHWAVWPNRPEILDMLLRAGADKDLPMADGSTLLHCAVNAEHLETVQCLLRYGANPLKKNEAWQTPLEMAESGHHEGIARLLRAAAIRKQLA